MRIKSIMTKMIWFLYRGSNPKVLMFTCSSNATPAACLPMLTDLTPAAVAASPLPSTLSKPSSHSYYRRILQFFFILFFFLFLSAISLLLLSSLLSILIIIIYYTTSFIFIFIFIQQQQSRRLMERALD